TLSDDIPRNTILHCEVSTMSTTNVNGGVPRKTLASQLDRLDGIIDTLAEGLNGAVADAVRDEGVAAVRQAVEHVLREVLAHPDLLRVLGAHLAPINSFLVQPVPAPPGSQTACARVKGTFSFGWRRLLDKAKAACRRVGAKVRALPGRVRDGLHQARAAERLQSVRRFAARGWESRGPVSVSLVAGAVTGVLGYAAGPAFSAVALGACA